MRLGITADPGGFERYYTIVHRPLRSSLLYSSKP
jgi:hypothetical protein